MNLNILGIQRLHWCWLMENAFFFSFFTLSVVRPDRPVQEREGSKNLKTEYEE